MSDETNLLVLGGLGFIGRHFVKYVADYGLATRIRVVDKVVPAMAFLSPDFEALFKRPEVEVMQKHLARDDHVQEAFAPSEAVPGKFHMVVNLAAETAYGKPDAVYNESITALRIKCAQAAAAAHVDKYIEVSTAQVYEGKDKDRATETGKLAPWTNIAKAHLAAEEAVRRVPGLDLTILRLPIVYGPGDRTGLLPRLSVAAVYAHTGETMQLLHGESLRLNTVHVQDVGACIYHLLCSGAAGEVYNLADKGDTSQGSLNKVLEEVFATSRGGKLKVSYMSSILTGLAGLTGGLEEAIETANDGHMSHWGELCKTAGVGYTPLVPWLEKELLYKHHLSVDAAKLEATGFAVSCPEVTKELLIESLNYWAALGKFPALDAI